MTAAGLVWSNAFADKIWQMEIRDARPEDIPDVLVMVVKTCAMHEAMSPLKYPFEPQPEERYRGWLRQCIEKAIFLVADDGDKAVGFLVATVEDEIPIYRVKRFGFVQDLWVEERYRRHGLARKLLERAAQKARAKGLEQLRLDVLLKNKAAMELFHNCGFQQTVVEMVLPLSRESRD